MDAGDTYVIPADHLLHAKIMAFHAGATMFGACIKLGLLLAKLREFYETHF